MTGLSWIMYPGPWALMLKPCLMNSACHHASFNSVSLKDPGVDDGVLVPGTHGIGDEQVAESAPMVRALVVSRLEMIWRACEPHILPPPVSENDYEPPRKPDPRFVEAGIRVNDRLIALYGLLKTSPGQEKGEDTAQQDVDAAIDRVKALEARLRSQE